MTTTIILGPRTRAGLAAAERAVARGDEVFVVARHDVDASALSGLGATVLRIDADLDLVGVADGPVRILVCALGPVHPVEVRTEADSEAFLRDLGLVERLLAATSDHEVGVVLISSVIALAPGTDRRYYGGWKCLVEQQLAETVRRLAPSATFSVVYPGRLVETTGRRLVPSLHTSYSRLAATVDALASGPSRARLSGLDARLWMVVNAAKILLHSILPLSSPASGRPLEQSVSAHERSSRP